MQNTSLSLISRQNHCRLLFLAALLLLLSYSNSFHASWQFDDAPNILENRPQQLTELTNKAIWDSMTADPGKQNAHYLARPLARLTLGLNWFFGQDDVTGYHVVNFLIHLGSTFFLFSVIVTLFKTPRLQGRYTPFQITFIAICAALFWALNPIQVQAVTYIVQRMASLATFFTLLAILFYLKARLRSPGIARPLQLTLSVVFFLCALFSKENAVLIIFFIPLFELLFFKFDITRKDAWSFFKILLFVGIICIAAMLVLKPTLFSRLFDPSSFSARSFTQWQRVLTEQRLMVFYLSQIFFPLPGRLSIEHDIILSTSLFSPITTIISICFNLSLFVSALFLFRRQPLFSLAIIFFYLNHLIESTILSLELLFEHRNYLPSLFLFLPVAQFMSFCIEKTKSNILIKSVLILFGALLFSSLAFGTYTRNKAWKTAETLWLDAASKAPQSQRPHSSLALYYGFSKELEQPDLRKALKHSQEAVYKSNERANQTAGLLRNVAALHMELQEYDDALRIYEEALQEGSEDPTFYYNYAKFLFWLGDFRKSEEVLTALFRDGYRHPDCWNLFALIKLWTGKPDKALEAMQAALKNGRYRPIYYFHLGKSFSMLGYHDKARFFYGRALYYGKENNILALARIENALLDNDGPQAKAELKRALKNHTLPVLVKPLLQTKKRRIYDDVPLERELLLSFLSSELGNLDTLITDSDNEQTLEYPPDNENRF